MGKDEFVRLVESLAEMQPKSLNSDSKLEDFGWDSLCVIGLISELDRLNLGSINADSISEAETIENLYRNIFVD